MKQNKSVQIIFLSLILSCFFLSGEVFAWSDNDLKRLKKTRKCQNCSLQGAGLYNADLRGAVLTGSVIDSALLSFADLRGADLSGADLRGSFMNGADLSGADLSGANLSCGRLTCSNLSGANLSGANLSGANLFNANLSGANLTKANLTKANFTKANLTGTKLSGVKLRGAYPYTNLKNAIKQSELDLKRGYSELELMILGDFYSSYAILKQCYEARKGYQVVHLNSVEMATIKSKAKSIENGILGKYPKLEPKKVEIWEKFTKILAGEMTSDYRRWKFVCDNNKSFYAKLKRTYGGGSKIEKDF